MGSRVLLSLKEQPMANLYASPGLTAFVSTRQVDKWHVGVVAVLLGTQPSRIEEECLALRDTPAERCTTRSSRPRL